MVRVAIIGRLLDKNQLVLYYILVEYFNQSIIFLLLSKFPSYCSYALSCGGEPAVEVRYLEIVFGHLHSGQEHHTILATL